MTQDTHGVHAGRRVPRRRAAVYDELMAEQLVTATEKRGAGDLAALLHSGETWTISQRSDLPSPCSPSEK